MKIKKIPLLTLLAFLGIILIFPTGCKNENEPLYDLSDGSVTDINGNTYPTVIIGTQEWMASNLKATKYNDGRPIDNPGINNREWENNKTGAYSWYNNDEAAFKENFGALYNWHAVQTGKLCPAGWRVPSDEDWTKVNQYMVVNPDSTLKSPDDTTDENSETVNFLSFPGGARFSALTGGSSGSSTGYFHYLGESGRWWTSSEHSSTSAWYRSVYPGTGIYRGQNYKETGFSVRCVRDALRIR